MTETDRPNIHNNISEIIIICIPTCNKPNVYRYLVVKYNIHTYDKNIKK